MFRITLLPLLAGCAFAADNPFFFYAENVGQEDAGVKYRLNTESQRTYLGANSIHIQRSYGGPLTLRFASGEPSGYQSLERWPGILNRFEGEPRNWRRGIPAHRRIQYDSIAPGVDAVFGSVDGVATLTFAVRPGGELNSLFLDSDSERTNLDEAGETWTVSSLTFEAAVKKRRAWQEIRGATTTVDARFRVVSPQRIGVTAGTFDRSQPLYVEVELPAISPPPSDTTPVNIVRDKAGNSYRPAIALSDRVCAVNPGNGKNFCPDAAVSAVRPNGEPIFLTVLAGTYDDLFPLSSPFLLDRDGNVFIAGRTGSADFPVTADAYQPVNAGPIGPFGRLVSTGGDLFVSMLDPNNGNLLYSTFLGGADWERDALLTGSPGSSIAISFSTGNSFRVSPGAWLSTGERALAVFDTSRRQFRFATFVPPFLNVSKVGSDSSVYLGGDGRAGSPTTEGAVQNGYGGGDSDGYLVRIAPDGTRPLFATYYGGPGSDGVRALDVDAAGDLWFLYESRPTAVRQDSKFFLAHLSGDGSRLVAPLVGIPSQSVYSFRSVPAGDVLLLSAASAGAAITTPDASLRGSCNGPSGLANYFQVFRSDGTLRFASYLMPGESRGIEELYADYLPHPGQPVEAAAPSLVCVTNAASRRNSGGVSPGQIVTLLGMGLGPAVGVVAAPGQEGRYPTAIGRLRVFADDLPMPLLYAEAGQINAIMPYSIQAGRRVTVTVEFEGRRSSVTLDVVPSALQLFSLDASGSGQAVALNQDGLLNSPANPAEPGSILVVYGTGGGLTAPLGADGALAPPGPIDALPKPQGKVAMQLFGYDGETFAEVLYIGAAPGLVNGLMQINFRLPDKAPSVNSNAGVFAGFSFDGSRVANTDVSLSVRRGGQP